MAIAPLNSKRSVALATGSPSVTPEQRRKPDDAAPVVCTAGALVALSRDYSETPQRLLLVIGAATPEFAHYLREINACSHTDVADQTLLEAADPSKRCFVINTPIQMVPEINRWLALRRIAVYQLSWVDEELLP